MKRIEKKLDVTDKLALAISLMLFIVNFLLMFDIIHVHRGVSALVLSLTIALLGYFIFKNQSKRLGYIYLICAILLFISGIITFI